MGFGSVADTRQTQEPTWHEEYATVEVKGKQVRIKTGGKRRDGVPRERINCWRWWSNRRDCHRPYGVNEEDGIGSSDKCAYRVIATTASD
jgi:hypothetical protein